jgi:hypothetical protein
MASEYQEGGVKVLVFATAALTATGLVTAPRAAHAQKSDDESLGHANAIAPAEHTHNGLYLRLQLGEGFARFTANDHGRDLEISGPLTSWIAAVGVAPVENLIVYGETVIAGFNDPKGKIGGRATATTTTSMGGIGGGVAYYFPAPNVYLAGSLLFLSLEAHSGKIDTTAWGLTFEGLAAKQGDASTELGAAIEGLVGKEWWISHRWGLGAAAEILAGRAIDDSSSAAFTWTATSFALLFSATYN